MTETLRIGAAMSSTSLVGGLYHLHFDYEPEVQAHVCDVHRAFASAMPCPDDPEDHGSCMHIQYTDCDCPEDVGCFACRNLQL